MSGVGRNMWPFAVPLFLILLRNNWHTSLCRFKAFSAMVWYTYIVKWLPQSVQFSHSVVSDSLWPHGLQHARPPCLSPTPGVYSNLCLLSKWCHPTISSSVIPFSFCLQSFPASGCFQMSQLFASGGQSTRIERDMCTLLFITALFIIARTWKQPRCPSAD